MDDPWFWIVTMVLGAAFMIGVLVAMAFGG
jgi:hypothetical protein